MNEVGKRKDTGKMQELLQLKFFVLERMCAVAATTDCVGFIIPSHHLTTCAGCYGSIAPKSSDSTFLTQYSSFLTRP